MRHIPLKQYIDSKRQLLDAIELTPVTMIEYEIRKYCTIPVGEADDSTTVALKPKQQIVIEWVYDNPNQPTPAKITIVDKDTQLPSEEQDMFWTGDKLNKWLMRYAKEGKNVGHRT